MRVFCFVLIIVSAFNNSYSTSQDTINNKSFEDIQILIDNGLVRNLDLIKEKSKNLTDVQRKFIYDECKISPFLPFILNLSVGFGIGSWVQGHTAGGLIGTFGNFGGLMLWFSSNDRDNIYHKLGFYLLFSTWLVDCILPFSYSHKYNKKLKNTLEITGITNLMISPNINMAKNGNVIPGILLSVNF